MKGWTKPMKQKKLVLTFVGAVIILALAVALSWRYEKAAGGIISNSFTTIASSTAREVGASYATFLLGTTTNRCWARFAIASSTAERVVLTTAPGNGAQVLLLGRPIGFAVINSSSTSVAEIDDMFLYRGAVYGIRIGTSTTDAATTTVSVFEGTC